MAWALAAWMLGFAAHVHVPGEKGSHTHGVVHVCTVCASLGAGISSDTVSPVLPLARPVEIELAGPSADLRVRPTVAYLSRAPPTA